MLRGSASVGEFRSAHFPILFQIDQSQIPPQVAYSE